MSLTDPKLAGELKLTEPQRKAIADIASDRSKQINAVITDASVIDREKAVKIVELSKTADAAVRKVLTADQKTQWEALIGKPFRWPEP